MANFFRLIFVSLAVFFSGQVFADCTAAITTCNGDIASSPTYYAGYTCSTGSNGGVLSVLLKDSSGTSHFAWACASACPSPQVLNASGACVPPPPVSGTVMATGWIEGTPISAGNFPQCFNGAEVNFNGNGAYSLTPGGVANMWKGSYISNGKTCSGTDSAASSPINAPAAAPLAPAPSAPTATPTTATPTAVTPYSGPTVVNNNTTITTNTTTQTTDSTGGISTSTTTGTSSSTGSIDLGPVVGAVNQTTAAVNNTTDAVNKTAQAVHDNSIFQFCIDNPTLPECAPSQIVDACNAFTCSGDAIQCAMAQSQHDVICQYTAETNPNLDVGKAMIAGTDTTILNPAAVANRLSVPMSTSLDSSSPIAAACPADVPFSLMGQNIVIPLSLLCSTLTVLGNVFMALAFLSAAKIIGGV